MAEQNKDRYFRCWACNGNGSTPNPLNKGKYGDWIYEKCSECNGTGKIKEVRK